MNSGHVPVCTKMSAIWRCPQFEGCVRIGKFYVILSFLFFLKRYLQAKRPRKEAAVSIKKNIWSPPSISSSRHDMQLKSGPAIPIVKWWQSIKWLTGSRDWCIICYPETTLLMTSSKIKDGVISKLLFSRRFWKT